MQAHVECRLKVAYTIDSTLLICWSMNQVYVIMMSHLIVIPLALQLAQLYFCRPLPDSTLTPCNTVTVTVLHQNTHEMLLKRQVDVCTQNSICVMLATWTLTLYQCGHRPTTLNDIICSFQSRNICFHTLYSAKPDLCYGCGHSYLTENEELVLQ